MMMTQQKGLSSLLSEASEDPNPCRIICRDAKNTIALSLFSKVTDGLANALSSDNSPVIGVCLRPTCLIPVVLVAILKANKAFCCFDKLVDDELIESCFVSLVIVDDDKQFSEHFCNVRELVVDGLELLGRLFVGQPLKHSNTSQLITDTALGRNEIAYVAFTSGSTGKPKPIFVTHNSIVPNILDFNGIWDITQSDVVALMSPLTFDPSFIEIFCSLSSGAVLSVISPEKRLNSSSLVDCLLENGVTIIQITPSLFSLFSQSDLQLLLHSHRSKLKIIAFGGEHFPFPDAVSLPPLLREWLSRDKGRNGIFNLYGVTEVSCWCSVVKINYESLKSTCTFPDVGAMLSDSRLVSVLPNKNMPNFRIRELAISTRYRRCYVGAELLSSDTSSTESFVKRTGDLIVPLKSGGFKIVGRVDDFIKRFGRKVNTHLLEESVLNFLKEKARRVVAVQQRCKNSRTKLNLCVFLASERCNHPSAGEVQGFVRTSLGQIYVPDQVHFTSLSVPLSRHGKVSRTVVRSFFESVPNPAGIIGRSVFALFADLWHEITGKVPTTMSRFVEDGGDSIGVIRICETIRQATSRASLVKLADLLLTKTFGEVEAYLNDEANFPEHSNVAIDITAPSVGASESRAPVTFGVLSRAGNVFGNIPQLLPSRKSSVEVKNCKLNIEWQSYFEKCIDGSPLLKISQPGGICRLFIASHSGLVRCLNGQNGDVIWEFRVAGRVEASLALSACGNYVIFGAYDNSIYVIKEDTGELHFRTSTGDIVKSTPSVDYNGNGFVYVGSHDGTLYVIEPVAGKLAGKVDFKCGAILSSPLISSSSVLVCTLQGKILCFGKNSYELHWKFDAGSPIFSTPIELNGGIAVVATVSGDILALSVTNGEVTWRLEKICGNIFAPLTHFEENFALIAAHSGETGSLACINCHSGTLKWKTGIPISITGAPFVANGLAFVFDTKGSCYVLRTNDGSFISSSQSHLLKLPGDVFSSPVFFDNHLYVGCRDDYLYCLKIELE